MSTVTKSLARQSLVGLMALGVGLATAFFCTPASAALITGVTAVSIWDNGFGGGYAATYAVNGGGLTGNQHTAVDQNGAFWDAGGIGGSPSTRWIKVDLGAVYSLDHLHIWNFNTNPSNTGAKNFDIWVRPGAETNNLQNNAAPFNSTGYTLAQSVANFGIGPVSNTYTGEPDISLLGNPGATNVRYLAINVTLNHGASTEWGLSEIQFFSAETAVPEPSTLVLAGMGLVALGFVAWKKR